jgi:hypothetical protein
MSAIVEKAKPTEAQQFANNEKLFENFFACLAFSCCIVLIIPGVTSIPKYVLSSLFFTIISIVGLFLVWVAYSDEDDRPKVLLYSGMSMAFVLFTLGYAFYFISKHSLQIQNGQVTNYYSKFNFIMVILLLIECALFYICYITIKSKNDPKTIAIATLIFASINSFVIWSNNINLTHFSASG